MQGKKINILAIREDMIEKLTSEGELHVFACVPYKVRHEKRTKMYGTGSHKV